MSHPKRFKINPGYTCSASITFWCAINCLIMLKNATAELSGSAGPGTAPQPQHPPRPLLPPRLGSVRLRWPCCRTCLPLAPTQHPPAPGHASLPSAGFGPQTLAANCPQPPVGIGTPASSLGGTKLCALEAGLRGVTGGDQQHSWAIQAAFCKAFCGLLLPAVGSSVPRGWQHPCSGHCGAASRSTLVRDGS